MNDMGNALRRATARTSESVAATLGEDATVATTASAIRRGRMVRTSAQATAAVVGIGVIGAGAWYFAPRQVEPATVDDAVVRSVSPVPEDGSTVLCTGDAADGTLPYVPWDEPGVWIADESVRDLGIEVSADMLIDSDVDGTWEVAEPGGTVDRGAVEIPDTDGDTVEQAVNAQFRVSWDGDATYGVTAVAVLESDGRLVNTPVLWPLDVFASGDNALTQTWPQYDDGSDRTTTASLSQLDSSCLIGALAEGGIMAPASGEATVHTLVQVRDENGAPLATFVDAQAIAGTTVTFSSIVEHGATVDIPAVTEAETAAIEDQRAGFAAAPPTHADAQDLISATGVPLAEAGAGMALAQTCEAEVESAVDPRVAPLDPELPPVPGQVSLSGLGVGAPVIVDGEPSADAWYIDAPQQWIFLKDGAVVGNVSASLSIEEAAGDEVDGVGIGVRAAWYPYVDDACGGVSRLTPGDFDLVMVAQGWVPPEAIELWGVEDDGTFSTWIDAGQVTVVE
ncbi:hypothetical protein [Demequina sp. NBRC 110057]|uniref:hypothetical protein n=1 Tax=Demequina sp. NBRC 110057 TaxID=1570346 RepID=UPI000A040F93|nr:hypothetical protein [Demequina sp. NBRC 110057]